MQKIKDAFVAVMLWIWRSSADPNKVSFTVKAALLGAATWAVFFGGILNLPNLAGTWNEVAEAVAEFIGQALYVVSAIGIAYGGARKLYLTAKRALRR